MTEEREHPKTQRYRQRIVKVIDGLRLSHNTTIKKEKKKES